MEWNSGLATNGMKFLLEFRESFQLSVSFQHRLQAVGRVFGKLWDPIAWNVRRSHLLASRASPCPLPGLP